MEYEYDVEDDVIVVGKFKLNEKISPCIEVIADNATARGEVEIVVFKQIFVEDRAYYTDKVPYNWEKEAFIKLEQENKTLKEKIQK